MNKHGNPYLDENNVPYNKFGITADWQRKLVEYDLTMRRGREILSGKVSNLSHPSSYGFQHLQEIHKYLFDGMYPQWAGKTRTISFAKKIDGGNMVSVFADPDTFSEKWLALEKKTSAFVTAKEWTLGQKVDALVSIFADANHIHPFPEGNGRTLQVFMNQLAREQGMELDYTKASPKEWNRASAVSGVHGEPYKDAEGYNRLHKRPRDLAPITRIFSSMARPGSALKQVSNLIDRASAMIRQTVFGGTAKPNGISLSALGDRQAYKRAKAPTRPALTQEQQAALRDRLGSQARSADAAQRPDPDADPGL